MPSSCDLLIVVTQSRSIATLIPIEERLRIDPKVVMTANANHALAGALW